MDYKLDQEIFSLLLKIYKEEGREIFNFSEKRLQKTLSDKAFQRLKDGQSTLGKISLYGGRLGQYYALNISNGDFYKRLRNQ